VVKKVKEGYKKTELGWIPDEWEVGKFEDILVPRKETFNPKIEENEMYVGLEHIEEVTGRLICTGNSSDTSSIKNKFYNGDILFGKLRPYLRKYYMTDFNGVCVTEILVLTKKKSNNKFCYYSLQQDNFIEYINSKTFGTKMPRTSWNDIKEYPVCIPPLKEQQKIAEILSSVDTQIDDTDKFIEKTKELKKGLMQRFLTKGIGHTEFKMTEVGDIPMEWEVKKISDICNVNGGKRLPKGYQLIDDKNKNPYIRVADMHNGGISLEDIKYVPNEAVNSIKNYTISKDDLFISVAGTLGIVGKVPECLDGANLTENADKLCDIKINKDFLMRVLQSDLIQKIIDSEKTSNAQPKLALTRIKEFLIPIPEKEEQEKIANILISVDTQIEDYENKKTKLEELKKGLMQKLLTGKIRVV